MCYTMDKEGMKVVLDISHNMCASCAWGVGGVWHGRRSGTAKQKLECRAPGGRENDEIQRYGGKRARSSFLIPVIIGCQ